MDVIRDVADLEEFHATSILTCTLHEALSSAGWMTEPDGAQGLVSEERLEP
jgi:hypothetical protein